MISVISVVMKARSRRYPINRPLTAPSAAPHTSVATITAGTGQSRTLRQNSAQKSHSANIEPTERSMPPTMTTSAMPSTTKPISPACRPVSARPATREEAGDRSAQQDGDDQEHDHRDRGLGPALGQDFAEQMIRPVAISQTKKRVLHRQPGIGRRNVIGMRRARLVAGDERPCDAHGRSLVA